MVQIEQYITELIARAKHCFGKRLVYVGLQGSYLRGEATEDSDIDIMVVIDDLSVNDLDCYGEILSDLGYTEKSCGFICGKSDLANWNKLEICHLLHTTRDYFGKLQDIVPSYTDEDIKSFVKLSVNNLYHEICHRYIHGSQERSIAALAGSYKSVFFVLQNVVYLKSGIFAGTKAELLSLLSGKDRDILERSLALNSGVIFDFQDSFELLFSWCQEMIASDLLMNS